MVTPTICLFNRWRCDLEKRTASVLAISYVTALHRLHSSTTLATSPRVLASSLTEYPEAIKTGSSIEDKDVTAGLDSATSSKNPLIYIRKSRGETGDPCGIPVSISRSLLSYPSITIWTLRSVRKDCVHRIISPSFSQLFLFLKHDQKIL